MSTDDDWNDDSYEDEYDEQDNYYSRRESDPGPRKKKQGMSTGIKVLIVLLCVGGGFFVLCCGGIVLLGMRFGEGIEETPEGAVKITNQIAEIEIPEELFLPQMGMDFDMFFFQMKMSVYSSATAEGMLMLMEMNVSGSTPEEQEPEMRKAMRRQNFGEMELDVKKSESRTFTIRGREVGFQFIEGENPDTGVGFRQVSGVFPGKGGTAFLLIQVEEDGYDEEAIVKIIESIK